MITLFKGYHYPMKTYTDNYDAGGFTQLSLDLTSNCNYRCDWCFNKHLLGKDPKDKLTLKQTKQLLDESVKLGVKTLVFPGTGEPTLDKNFYPIIEYANNLGLVTVVYSNLTGNVDENAIRMMYENNVSIGIKYDSLEPKHFIKRYKTPLFKKYIRNLNIVSKTYNDSAINTLEGKVYRIIGNMVLTHENKREIKALAKKAKELDFPLFVRPVKPVTWALKDPEEWKLLGSKTGKMTPDTELIQLAKEYNTLFSPSSTIENHCAIYSFGLTIKNNGDVQVCPDHHESRGKFGNIKEKPLQEIMNTLNQSRTIKPGFCVMLPNVEH